MGINRLQLNAAKTEFVWFVPSRCHHQFPLDDLVIVPAQVARSWPCHLPRQQCVKCGKFSLQPRSALSTLISSFITSKLDYCNVAPTAVCRQCCSTSQLPCSATITSHHHLWTFTASMCPVQALCTGLSVFAPSCVQNAVFPAASMEPHCHLRCASSADVIVSIMRCSTMGLHHHWTTSVNQSAHRNPSQLITVQTFFQDSLVWKSLFTRLKSGSERKNLTTCENVQSFYNIWTI